MIEDRIYDNIFDVIEFLDPNHPILKIKRNVESNILKKKNVEEKIGTLNKYPLPGNCGKPICKNGCILLYRGENQYYENCVANIFRDRSLDNERDLLKIAIDRIKISDFKQILLHFPQIKKAREDGYYVDFKAIAQHYGLRTSYIDLTSDIATALFFASTYSLDNNTFYPILDGYGYFRGYEIDGIDDNLKMKSIGVQPFLRPTRQDAFVYEATLNEDFHPRANFIIKFRQTKINQLFYNLCEMPVSGKEKLWPKERSLAYFPNEPDIINVSNYIINTHSLTRLSIEKYCRRNNQPFDLFAARLKEAGYEVVESTLFDLNSIDINRAKKEIEEKVYVKNHIFNFNELSKNLWSSMDELDYNNYKSE